MNKKEYESKMWILILEEQRLKNLILQEQLKQFKGE